jgi:hypothetical protein
MALADVGERPVEAGDGVRRVEHLVGDAVAAALPGLERRLGAVEDGARQALGVAQRVGNAVRGDRVAEEAGISDQRPPRTVAWRIYPGAPRKACRRASFAARLACAASAGESASSTSMRARPWPSRKRWSNSRVGTEATMQAWPSLVGMKEPASPSRKYQ